MHCHCKIGLEDGSNFLPLSLKMICTFVVANCVNKMFYYNLCSLGAELIRI